MPVFDGQLMLRTTGNLTQNESSGPVLLKAGTTIKGLAVRVSVPACATAGADDTIWPKIYESVDNSTYSLLATYKDGATKCGLLGKDLIIPFAISSKRYIKVELVITATTASTAFGKVVVGIVLPVGYDWDRTTHFV